MSEVENARQWMTRPREVPPSGVMSYTFLNDVMRFNCNPDYYAEGFPIHCAQNILKQVTQDLNSFFKNYLRSGTLHHGNSTMSQEIS